MSARIHAVLVLLFVVPACLTCRENSPETVTGTAPSEFIGRGVYLGEYPPTDQWRTCRPEEVGLSSDKLLRAYHYAADPDLNTEGLVIVKDGYIVGEAYFRDYGSTDRHYSYSVAKSFTSAVIGIAIDHGFIDGVSEQVYQYYPQWQQPDTDPRKQQITIRHLLTMTAGIEWNEDNYYSNSSNNDAFIMHRQPDLIQYVLNKPMQHTPGENWYYSTGSSQLLSGVIESATGQTVYEYALPNLLEPLGLHYIGWDHDDAGHTHTGSGVRATVREYAKFGYLYLNRGRWDDEQIVSEAWVDESVQPVSNDVIHYGYQWWLKPALRGHEQSIVPSGTYIAWGIYTQQIFVIPEARIVIARVGNDPNGWDEVRFLTLVLDAMVEP